MDFSLFPRPWLRFDLWRCGRAVFSLSLSFSSFLSHWNFRGLSCKNGQQMKPYIPAPTHLILRTAGPPQAKVMEGGTVCLDSLPTPNMSSVGMKTAWLSLKKEILLALLTINK